MTGKILLALLFALTTVVHANPPAEWIGAPNAVAEYVEDPVFGGRVALYRAGPSVSSPHAEAVVLVHGLGKAAARDWSKLIPVLATRHHVLAIDLPGFGHSDKGNHHYSPDNFARVLEAVLQKHALLDKREPQRFTLIGHSMGGSVALAYVAAYPQRVSRLVLVDAVGVLHRSVYAEHLARVGAQRAIGLDSPWFESVVRAIQNRMENWPLRGELVLKDSDVRQRVLRGDPNAISAFAMVEHDFSRVLRAIAAPTLVIWGAEDIIAPLRSGQALASAIPGARLTVIEGAGHAPQLQFPDRFNPLVIDELDGRQFAAQPYAQRSAPVRGTRAARCDGRRDQEFSGDYESLVLDNCPDARISNARIGRLQATHSTARILNSFIRDGIDAKNSRLELTGGTVGGRLTLDASSVDAAATRFESDAIASNSGSVQVVLRLSVASAGSGNAPRPLHDIFRLAPGETLIR
jgi:pimeloyl-ACP methyl ester carboxylesterase